MLRFYLTGRLAVASESDVQIEDSAFRARQERLRFSYLVLNRSRSIAREELLRLLWPGEEDAASEQGLKPLLSRVRGAIARSGLADAGVVLESGLGQIDLRVPADAWVDVEAAAHHLDVAEGALRRGEARAAFGSAVAVCGITSRAFLAGDGRPWAVQERGRLERQRTRALECLAAVWLECGEPALAIEAATEALTLEPFRESSARLLFLAHGASGNQAEAVRAYHEFRRHLADWLGIDPAPETERVFPELLGP